MYVALTSSPFSSRCLIFASYLFRRRCSRANTKNSPRRGRRNQRDDFQSARLHFCRFPEFFCPTSVKASQREKNCQISCDVVNSSFSLHSQLIIECYFEPTLICGIPITHTHAHKRHIARKNETPLHSRPIRNIMANILTLRKSIALNRFF